MSQQQSQPVAFNALKPATWGSLKLLPLALRSKLTGAKASDDIDRVAFGKENAGAQPQAPPKLGDLSHLQAIGPRRNVNQRYVLQPNLNVTRSALATHAPGLSGLLLPGMGPIATQYPNRQQQEHAQQQRQQTPSRQQQRSSTPSSPTLRGRQPQANPNFAPPAGNITTRLPTPVRINPASPGPSPSPTSLALALPKPPSPSLSQGGAPLANPFASASACSSPAASAATSNTFVLPTPPSILGNAPPAVALRSAARAAAQPPAPWASGAAAAQGAGPYSLTPTSTRPSPPPPERSILASIQLNSQNNQTNHHNHQHNHCLRGATPSVAALPGHTEGLAPVAAPAPALAAGATVSPVLTAPAIQAALQQALAGALERKPEAFCVDNFERFFDSLMHPGDAGKLDGPLPTELPDDVRYSDNWYKHCRDWNGRSKPSAPYSAPQTATAAFAAAEAAAPGTPTSNRLASTPFAAAEEREQQQLKPQWSLDEPPMSEACCKALDIAHHGLRKVLTPTARSRSVSDMTGGASAQRASTPPSLLERFQQQLQCASAAAAATAVAGLEGELEDTAASRPRVAAEATAAGAEMAHTAAALTTALEMLARDQAAAAIPAADAEPASPQRRLALALAASTAATPMAATAAQDASVAGPADNATEAVVEAALEASPSDSPVRSGMVGVSRPAAGRKFAVPTLLISSLDASVLPMAAGAALSPPPDSARPPSTAATTPGHKTPRDGGGGSGGAAADSVATTAATTPVGRAATPTTARDNASAASPVFGAEQLTAANTHEADTSAAPLRKLSRELAAATDLVASAAPGAPASATAPADAYAPVAGAMPPAVLWSPAFPPAAIVMARSATASEGTVPQLRSSSPVTLLQNAPRDMPTPNPAFFGGAAAPAAAGPSSLAAAVAAVAARGQAAGGAAPRGSAAAAAGPSTSFAPPASDPLKEIVVGIEKLSTLKQNILAEDKEVDVASITQMIQLKLAVEQLLARTSTAALQDATTASSAVSPPPPPAAVAAPVQAAAASAASAAAQAEQAGTPKKQSRSGAFGAFLKSVFSPRSGSASKAQAVAAATAPPAPASAAKAVLGASAAANANATGGPAAAVASPSATVIGVRAPRPMSASVVPRQAASPSLADRSRYAALHQRAAARLAEAAAEPAAGPRAAPATAAGAGASTRPVQQRGDVWQRYEEKIAMHRQQLDTTKSQLDDAVRKLNDMQAEFDELLLCLGMESAKNKALCDAMRAAGLDPEPILAAIEEQWMSGAFS